MMTTVVSDNITLEEFIANPPEHTEWVDGEVLEKNGMTFKHGRIISKLSHYWRNHLDSSGQGGEVCVDTPCRTIKQVRRPDVAYITPELIAQYGDFTTLPVPFPLAAEVVSPTDLAEDVLAKAKEYLDSNCLEVWLIFPKSSLVLVMTQAQIVGFRTGEIASTQLVLNGFSVAVDELLA